MSTMSLEEYFFQHCIVLDIDSSVSIFSNEDLLKDVGYTSQRLKLETNGGETRANKMGILHDLRVSLNAGNIANMLILSHVASRSREIMDDKCDSDIKVNILPGKWTKFVLNDISLHAHDVRNNAEVPSSNT